MSQIGNKNEVEGTLICLGFIAMFYFRKISRVSAIVQNFQGFRYGAKKLICYKRVCNEIIINFILVQATDGIFDNVPDSLLIQEMNKVQNCKDRFRIQQCANSIALMARKLSRDPNVSLNSNNSIK